jgi:hypothetical protein
MPDQQSSPAQPSRLRILLKALQELGPGQSGLYALYQLELRSGYLRQTTKNPPQRAGDLAGATPQRLLSIPGRLELQQVLGEAGRASLLAEADEIMAGRVRLFGGQPVPLQLEPPAPLLHWIEYERQAKKVAQVAPDEISSDVKYVWEPARLGWAFTLGRAYHLSGEEGYAETFWRLFETFLDANPPYLGLNWVSAQEAALRVLALAFGWQVFARSPHSTPERGARLAWAIAVHAARIPPTLIYARSQNNNHLLSEAAGLYTAGLALPAHPSAARWRRLGWDWFQRGLRSQIAGDGAYSQHSTNYQRLMLQLALWMNALAQTQGKAFSTESQKRVASATRWLLALLDRDSGGAPNLGPNDGAYILPLTVCSCADYRPVLQAAGLAFLGARPVECGAWDELSLWLCKDAPGDSRVPQASTAQPSLQQSPHILVSPAGDSWAYLRAAQFSGRPGHADQLHLDLWWRGLNIAQDPGTFLYNAPPPWDNRLAGSDVHNTLTVDGQDQMLRAGRFLFLERAQAQVTAGEPAAGERPGVWSSLTARHNGYRRLDLVHQRTVSALPGGGWLVEDALLPIRAGRASAQPHTASLHWLLPDWPWEVQTVETVMQFVLCLVSPYGPLRLSLSVRGEANNSAVPAQSQLVRAGKLLYGCGPVRPTWGWSSPTYGDKMPALSLRLLARRLPPFYFVSEWSFPETDQPVRSE